MLNTADRILPPSREPQNFGKKVLGARQRKLSPKRSLEKKKVQKINSSDYGGAIDEKRVRFADVEDTEPRMYVDRVLKGMQMLSAPAPFVQSFVHGIVDFIPRNIQGGDPYDWRYIARPEGELHNHLLKSTTGKGFKSDPPQVGKAISDSFGKFPELQALYHRQ